MSNHSDKFILDSWNHNASAWINTIENEEIESRKLATNQAIVDAVTSYSPSSIIDIGCGEGWLTRELTAKHIETWGIDGVEKFIEKAQSINCGKFITADYEEIINSNKIDRQFDAAVCNFSLLGKETVDNLIYSIPNFLKNKKLLFIQTLHPVMGCGELPYIDGWREELWNSFSSEFKQAAPWYFRKLETWINLINSAGFSILECREPIHTKTKKPASIIFIASYSQ